MSNQELLREKAILICEHCVAVGLPQPMYRIVSDYAVNFFWQHEGKKHTLSLYYPSWKTTSNSDWGKQVIEPAIQALFGQKPVTEQASTVARLAEREQPFAPPTPHVYFKNALESLALLTPFAHDNVDFSILCEQTREAVKMVLSDSTFSYLNQVALHMALDGMNP